MRRNKNLEELAELMIDHYRHGYVYNGEKYSAGEILAYYAKRIAKLEDELAEVNERIKRIPSHYIKKSRLYSKDSEDILKAYAVHNGALDSILSDLDIVAYFKIQKNRDKYY